MNTQIAKVSEWEPGGDATDYESGKPLVMKMKWKVSDVAGMKIRLRVPDTQDGFAVLIGNPLFTPA